MENKNNAGSDKFLEFMNSKTGKQLEEKLNRPLNALVSTRVSSVEQLKNKSLEVQMRDILSFAEKNAINIVATFGGNSESAKNDDEREELDRMFAFIDTSEVQIDLILVHKMDRFSRSGSNAIYLKEKLKKAGVFLQAVTQTVELDTPAGDLQQNMLLIFSHFDNQLRRDRTVSGIKAKLTGGGWPGKPKYGYIKKVMRPKEKPVCIIDETKAPHIRFIFESVGYNGFSQADVRKKLEGMGIKMPAPLISDILHNPFYCGYMRHGILEGEIVKGNHEPIISQELFMAVQKKLDKNPHGYTHHVENNFFPLKSVAYCHSCGYALTGYEVHYHDKTYRYYKCYKKRCVTAPADYLHGIFTQKLESLTITPSFVPVIKKQLLNTYTQLTEVDVNSRKLLNTQLTEERKKYHTLKLNLGLGQLPAEVFNELKPEFEQKIAHVEAELKKLEFDGSKIEKYLDKAMDLSCNMLKIWNLSDYDGRKRLQKLLFPQGLAFDPKNEDVLKGGVNPIFAHIACLTRDTENSKSMELTGNSEQSEVSCYPFRSSKTFIDELSRIAEYSWILPQYTSTISGSCVYNQYTTVTATTITYTSGSTQVPSSGNTMENISPCNMPFSSGTSIYIRGGRV